MIKKQAKHILMHKLLYELIHKERFQAIANKFSNV